MQYVLSQPGDRGLVGHKEGSAMIRHSYVLVLPLMAFSLLTSTASASAECAWMLWVQSSVMDPQSPVVSPKVFSRQYDLISPHESRSWCEDAAVAYMDTLVRPGTLQALGLVETGSNRK